MTDQRPDEYEQWDLSLPVLPPRSRLYQLEPIGMGTPMVESLTGYIVRLAEAHCVSAGVLYWKEIRALADKGNIFTFRIATHGGYSTHTINGLGSPATDFVRALETLTGRRDLCYLTLLTWANVLPGHSMQRRPRAWCESCLQTWREAEQPIYEPLLWTLRAVTLCPYHQRPLCQLCPHCQRHLGPLDARTRPGHCSRCEQWLVSSTIDPTPDFQTLTSDQLLWAIWVATTLGELLAAAPQLSFPPTRELLTQTISLCAEHTSCGNASAFARLLHVGRGDTSKWQRGKALPRLALLLSMAYRLGTSLLDFLSGNVVNLQRSIVLSPHPPPGQDQHRSQLRGRPRPTIKPTEVQLALQAALHENPPPSVHQVTKRTGHEKPSIYRLFPELCYAIARRFADHRKVQATLRKDLAYAEVKRVAYELHAKGIKLTRQHLRRLLTSSDYLNIDEGRAALREARSELGSNRTSQYNL